MVEDVTALEAKGWDMMKCSCFLYSPTSPVLCGHEKIQGWGSNRGIQKSSPIDQLSLADQDLLGDKLHT